MLHGFSVLWNESVGQGLSCHRVGGRTYTEVVSGKRRKDGSGRYRSEGGRHRPEVFWVRDCGRRRNFGRPVLSGRKEEEVRLHRGGRVQRRHDAGTSAES